MDGMGEFLGIYGIKFPCFGDEIWRYKVGTTSWFPKSTKIAAKMKIAVRNWTSLEPNEESEMNFAGTQKDLK